jgi:subtilase family protein
LKVFPSTSDSAPTSRVVAAMDRAITLRRNFNSGMPSVPVSGDGSEDNPFVFNSLKIDVVNMSLGGLTFFAGRELAEQLTTAMLSVGIAPAISAGNGGFGAMTAERPGDGVGALGVAAANDAAHERVLRDTQLGVGGGVLYRPTTHTQTAFFSSRGPTADGRLKPDIIANGFATYAQGTCGTNAPCLAGTGLAGISLVSGTSFSAPTAAGALALARVAAPSAPAVALRNALIDTANPNVLGDKSDLIDQGQGYLDVGAAIASLDNGQQSLGLESSSPGRNVRNNIQKLGFTTIPLAHGAFSTHLADLVQGQVAQFFVETQIGDRLTMKLTNLTPENPPAGQNQLFGDDLAVTIIDATTSRNQDLLPLSFIAADQTTTVITSPGIVRVAIQGDWTNGGRISADLAIELQHTDRGESTAHGTIAEGQTITVPFVVPSGAKQLDFELSWNDDWGRYPTNDLDLILRNPAGQLNFAGATAASPERVTIKDPVAGTWNALVQGFSIFTSVNDSLVAGNSRSTDRDTFELRVTIDGVRIAVPKNSK